MQPVCVAIENGTGENVRVTSRIDIGDFLAFASLTLVTVVNEIFTRSGVKE